MINLKRLGVDEDSLIETRSEAGGDFIEVGLLAEFGDVDENDFGLEPMFVEVFHGLKIEIITEIAAGVFRDNRVEAGGGKTLGELRKVDVGMIGDTVVAANGFEADGGEGCGLSFLVAEHFALAKEDNEVIVARREPFAELLGGGFETIFEVKFVVRRTLDTIEQGFAGIGGTSEGREQGSHENIIAQIRAGVWRIALRYYL